MLDRNYFSVLKNGEAPICLRITVNKKRAEVQIKRSIPINKWDAKKECCQAKDRIGDELNHYLQSVRTKVLRIHRELEQFISIAQYSFEVVCCVVIYMSAFKPD